MTDQIYQPISCHYYDELEALATQRVVCHLHYRNRDGMATCVETKLIDFLTIEKEEFLLVEDNLRIRLDHIISVNGHFPDNVKYC